MSKTPAELCRLPSHHHSDNTGALDSKVANLRNDELCRQDSPSKWPRTIRCSSLTQNNQNTDEVSILPVPAGV